MSSAVFWSYYAPNDNWAVWLTRDAASDYRIEWSGVPDWREAFKQMAREQFNMPFKLEDEP